MVLSIFCYNSETWTLTAETNRQLRVFEMGCLRQNVDIRANLGITEDIVERLQARRLRYFGHWSEWTNTVCRTLRYMVEWKRRESKEDPGSAGWIMLLMTDFVVAGASWRLHT